MSHVLAIFACLAAACGSTNSCPSGDCDPFATYQACYDEHHVTESFSVVKTIEVCCIDHPIGSAAKNVVCGATAATCTAYVSANLTDPADANLQADISTACTAYVVDRGG